MIPLSMSAVVTHSRVARSLRCWPTSRASVARFSKLATVPSVPPTCPGNRRTCHCSRETTTGSPRRQSPRWSKNSGIPWSPEAAHSSLAWAARSVQVDREVRTIDAQRDVVRTELARRNVVLGVEDRLVSEVRTQCATRAVLVALLGQYTVGQQLHRRGEVIAGVVGVLDDPRESV